MRITNVYNLPEVLVAAVEMDPYDSGSRGDKYVSVTQLVNPPQLTKLFWQHADELEEDVSERLWSLRGQAMHHVIERAASSPRFAGKVISEQRFYIERDGWTVGGQCDLLDIEKGLLIDFKDTSLFAVKDGGHLSWRRQVNVLSYILRQNGYRVESGEIVALLKDHKRAKAKYEKDYPRFPCEVVPVELFPDDVVEAFISRQLAELDSKTPRECSDEERWARGGGFAVMRGDSVSFAVMREGSRRAVRVYDDESEAVRHVQQSPDLFIQERRSESSEKRRAVKLFESLIEAEGFIAAHPEGKFRLEGREKTYERCESYCPVRAFCRQAASDSQVS